MTKEIISGGVVHKLPLDMRKAFIAAPKMLALWQDVITPLGRNEWICWVESAKKAETRAHRIEVMLSQMKEGKRRPCCWAGCPHR